MKKHSINRWIIRCFLVILLAASALSAAINYYAAYTRAVQLGTERATACVNSMTHMLHSEWTLEELSASTESDVYLSARKTLGNLCRTYQMDSLYVYRVDAQTGSRFFYLGAYGDSETDAARWDRYGLKTEAHSPILPEEEAILSGSREVLHVAREGQTPGAVTWVGPYYDRDGALRALVGMEYSVSWIRQETWRAFLTDIIPFLVSLLAGMLILLLLVRRRIVNPLHALSESMSAFSRDSHNKPEPLNIARQDEIGEIAFTYEKMTEDITDYLRNIEALTRKQAETDVQLDVARRIQNGLVPEQTNLSGDGYRICAMTRPAKEVGGDFYDCFRRNDGRVCVVMGDVSGKGISAAIFMAMTRTMIREKLLAGLSPSEALIEANEALCAQNPEGLFVTAFAAVLDPISGEMRFANAGHTHPILLGDKIKVLEPDCGMALGLFEDAGLVEGALALSQGEGILLYTDGVTDAINPRRAFFGMDGLLNALRSTPESRDAHETLLAISRALYAHCKGAEPFDDMAALALCRVETTRMRRSLPVALSSLDEVKRCVFAAVGETPEARRVILACDELIANIVQYSKATHLEFSCERREEGLAISFSDDGVYFDPTAVETEQMDFETLDGGGMGLNFVRQVASSIQYRREGGDNLLTLVFPLDG